MAGSHPSKSGKPGETTPSASTSGERTPEQTTANETRSGVDPDRADPAIEPERVRGKRVHPEAARPDSVHTVTGRVKWFDHVRGYGFLEVNEETHGEVFAQTGPPAGGGGGGGVPGASTGGSDGASPAMDVLIHASCLRASGVPAPQDGAELTCEVAHRERGLQAMRVLELIQPERRASAVLSQSRGRARSWSESGHPARHASQKDGAEVERRPAGALVAENIAARVKWFNRAQGYGFVTSPEVDGDVFLHMDVLRRCGQGVVIDDQEIWIDVIAGPKGLAVSRVALEPIAPDDNAG